MCRGRSGVADVRGIRSDFPLAVPIHTFITVGNVEEKVLFVMFLGKRIKMLHGVRTQRETHSDISLLTKSESRSAK